MALAYWDPDETAEGWTGTGHLQSADNGWIAVSLPGGLLHGDVDCDDDVDSVDALKVLRHVASLSVDLPLDCPQIGS
jgi:hypothetical protein